MSPYIISFEFQFAIQKTPNHRSHKQLYCLVANMALFRRVADLMVAAPHMLRACSLSTYARPLLAEAASATAAAPARRSKYADDDIFKPRKASKRTRKRNDVYYKPGPGSAGAALVQKAWGAELTSEPLRRSDFLNLTFFNKACAKCKKLVLLPVLD
jgi:hypothetical protein